MKPRKIDSSDVIGYLVSPPGEILADDRDVQVVCVEPGET